MTNTRTKETTMKTATEKKTVEEHAQREAKRRHGKKAFAMRTTGSPGLSGWFQCYAPCQGSGTWTATSVGKPFHSSDVAE
jgi:hypothetical protein